MGVTIDDVRHVAALARLGVSDHRAQALVGELNVILDHVAQLKDADTSQLEAVGGIGASGMELRPDDAPPVPLTRPMQDFAPSMRDGFLLVPRLSTHETAEES
jgi:aspartyl-tRNA(Asn)/glutamyl-tRNA(Gln) amidotransferase subunit C